MILWLKAYSSSDMTCQQSYYPCNDAFRFATEDLVGLALAFYIT